MTNRIRALAGTVAFAALLAPLNAGAQQADSSDQTADEIIVTAQKREQSINDVPFSITSISSEAIEQTHARTIADLTQLAPSVSLEPSSGYDTLSIRGVGGGGRNIGFDTRAGLYIDGVYIGQTAALSQPLFEIERVEVLRGPQGHLFGRNTVAGAVNLVTAAPSDEFGASFRGIVGNDNATEIHAVVEGPLAGEQVLGKIAAAFENRDGYTTNLFNGQDLDGLERTTLRGQLRFLPSDNLTIAVNADYSDAQKSEIIGEPQTDFFGVVTPGFPAPARRVNFNVSPHNNVELSGASVTADLEFGGGYTLTSVTGYRAANEDHRNDTDYSPNDLLFIDFLDESRQFTQELRIASPAEAAVRYVAGVYFLSEQADTLRIATIGQDTNTIVPFPPAPGGVVPFGPAFGLAPGAEITVDGEIETQSYAAFLALDADVTDWLTLNFGARYTHETKDLVFNLDGSQSGAFGIAVLNNYTDDRSENRLTPTLGFTIAASEDINLYVRYATGFKSGGFNVDFLNGGQTGNIGFDTETVESYEAGIKGTLFDRRLRFDAAVFQAQYDDFQLFQFVELAPGVTVLQLRNAAEAETQGFEAQVDFGITSNLRVGAVLGIVDATFASFPNGGGPGVDLAGNELPNSPPVTGALTIDLRVPVAALDGAFNLYAEYSYRDESFSESTNNPVTEALGARSLVNTRLNFTPDQGSWSVSLWARNVFDEDYAVMRGQDFLGNQITLRGEPRMFGAELALSY
jgi:iron complex outermembrane recepter protein